MRALRVRVVSFWLVFFGGSAGGAEPGGGEGRRLEIDFSGDEVTGTVVKPEGSWVSAIPVDPRARALTPGRRRAELARTSDRAQDTKTRRWRVDLALSLAQEPPPAGCDDPCFEAWSQDSALWMAVAGQASVELLAHESPSDDRVADLGRHGQLLSALGRRGEAVATWRQLLALSSRGPAAGDAWLGIGEQSFEESRLDVAVEAYTGAMVQGRPEVAAYAAYKRAWCLLNLGDQDGAMADFLVVVGDPLAAPTLRKAAMIDIFGCRDINTALPALKRGAFGSPDLAVALRRGALLRLAYAEPPRAERDVLVDLIVELDPVAPDLARILGEIVDGLIQRRQTSEALVELRLALAMCGPGSVWSRRQAPRDAARGLETLSEPSVRVLGALVDECRKTRSRPVRDEAVALAAELRSAFGDDPAVDALVDRLP